MYRQSVNTQELNKRSTDVFDEYMEDAAKDGLVPLLKVPIPYTSDRMFGEGEGFLHDDVKAMEPMVHCNASNGLMVSIEEWENLFELSMEDDRFSGFSKSNLVHMRTVASNLAFSSKASLFEYCNAESDPLYPAMMENAWQAAHNKLGDLHLALESESRASWGSTTFQALPTTAAAPRAAFEEGDEDESMAAAAGDFAQNSDNTARAFIQRSGPSNKKALLACCVGLGVSDWTEDPYKTAKQKTNFKPQAIDLAKEMGRRLSVSESGTSAKVPKYSNWPIAKMLEWLKANPNTDQQHIAFLLSSEEAFRKIATSAKDEPSMSHGGWYTIQSHLRLYHVMVEDEIRAIFLGRHTLSDRAGTDARNNENRPANVYEAATEKYNDTNYNPMCLQLPSLHHSFMESFSLSKDMVHLVTPDEVK
jgi:hypothetical protein